MGDGLTQAEDWAYCAAMVRDGDPDRFATAMLAPLPERRYLMALYAFNLEIGKLRENVREPILGEIRLQWWRDVLAECVEGTPRRHQVAQPLAETMARTGLPVGLLLEALGARAQDLSDIPPADEAAVSAYVDKTGGSIGELALRCLLDAGKATTDQVRVGRSAGRAWAWIGLARGLHIHRQIGRRTIPDNWLREYPVLDRDVQMAIPSDAVRAWTGWLLAQGRAELAIVRAGSNGCPKSVRMVLAPARLALVYAHRLDAVANDPFQPQVNQLGPARRAWSLLGISLFGLTL